MKTLKNILAAFALVAVLSVSVNAQDETATVQATATVTGALTINVTDIALGAVSASTSIYLQANGSDATPESNTGAGAQAGAVALSAGVAGAQFTVSWNTAILTDQDGLNPSNFTPTVYTDAGDAVTSGVTTLSLDVSGEETLNIGGAWTSPAAAGTYATNNGGTATPITLGITYL